MMPTGILAPITDRRAVSTRSRSPRGGPVRGAWPCEPGGGPATLPGMTQRSPVRCFETSPEVIRLAVMLHVRFSLSLRNVEDFLHERGIE